MGWSTIIGGAIGAVVGGPVGALAGAAAGALFEDESEDGYIGEAAPKIDGNFGMAIDQDGTYIRFTFASLAPDTILAVHALYDEQYLKANHSDFSDNEGDFRLVEIIDGNTQSLYIPKGAIQTHQPSITLEMTFIRPVENNDPILLGKNRYAIDIVPSTYVACHLWRPFIYLCTYVGYADGHLDESEIETLEYILIHELDIPENERAEVRRLMTTHKEWSLQECIKHYKRRFPDVEAFALLKCLSLIANADGVIDPKEVAVIEQVHNLLGLPPSAWNECAQSLGLIQNMSDPKFKEYRELLGVSENATATEIKRAFRKMAAEYHPDKHQNLPPHFQQFATEMMQKLVTAKDELLKIAK